MSIKRIEEIDRFPAVSDDGYEVILVVEQPIIAAGHMGDPHKEIAGRLKDYRTIDGYAVNEKDDDTFQILNDPYHPGLIVHRVK